jgi:hypothetical protein
MNANRLNDILARHGVSDAHLALDSFMDKAPIKRTDEPDVHMRGSVHQMKDLVTTRESVQIEFSQLEHL